MIVKCDSTNPVSAVRCISPPDLLDITKSPAAEPENSSPLLPAKPMYVFPDGVLKFIEASSAAVDFIKNRDEDDSKCNI